MVLSEWSDSVTLILLSDIGVCHRADSVSQAGVPHTGSGAECMPALPLLPNLSPDS